VAEPLARIEGLSYRYPGAAERALADVDLEIAAGELVVLAGRSASGKTSLLRALCGLVPHYHGGEVAGIVEVAGLDARDHGPAELGGEVGLVAQDPETQVVSTTVRAELELPLEIRGTAPAARARSVEEAALALAIPHLLDRTTDSLSGGELQRVALAAALVLRPRLVLLDEPTSQLDPVAGDELVWLLRRLNEEWGMSIFLAEHRLERCLAHADRVVAMAAGRIAFDGGPAAYLEWATVADPDLSTPGARMFDLAGLRPLPVGVKQAREALAASGVVVPEASPQTTERPGAPPIGPTQGRSGEFGPWRGRRRREDLALEASDAWVELGGRDVIHGLDLAVRPGERVALMGRNGAGKSTLLRAAAGRLEPLRGRIRAPRGCALLPQSPADMLLRERVGDELPGEAGARALAAVGLEGAVEADPRDLSGGERQRLALAIVMAGREGPDAAPGLVLLDEPTRGMDWARKRELSRWLAELADGDSGVVVATHDVEFAAAFAERVVLLADGAVIADGAAEEILAGGWYFATEVARILDRERAISPQAGAALVIEAKTREDSRQAKR
jgi:energy-coupling factor transport system ATP-binding protein